MGKKKEDFLTPTLRRAYITKVKPEKRYCSSDEDSDGDWGGSKKKKKKGAAAKKSAPAPAQPKSPLLRRLGRQWSSKVPTVRSPSKRLDNSMFINIPPTGKKNRVY